MLASEGSRRQPLQPHDTEASLRLRDETYRDHAGPFRPTFELVFELLDVPEERNAALTPTVSKGWGLSGRSGIPVTP